MKVPTIVSGAQTGADRAALDWAISHSVPHRGWCPKGRIAEDGIISSIYNLQETPLTNYIQRTEWNVRDSDGTVIFSVADSLTGGSKATADIARRLGKPWLHLPSRARFRLSDALRRFIQEQQIGLLNVAGPRASKEPMVGGLVSRVLEEAFFAPTSFT